MSPVWHVGSEPLLYSRHQPQGGETTSHPPACPPEPDTPTPLQHRGTEWGGTWVLRTHCMQSDQPYPPCSVSFQIWNHHCEGRGRASGEGKTGEDASVGSGLMGSWSTAILQPRVFRLGAGPVP